MKIQRKHGGIHKKGGVNDFVENSLSFYDARADKYTHTHRYETETQPDPPESSRTEKQSGVYLGLVALLWAQTGSSSVKLLGYDAQELSLVLGSVAVRRADVHHLEEEGGQAGMGTNTKERRTETV